MKVNFSFGFDGLDAGQYVNAYLNSLKEKDKHARIDLEVTTRFLA